MKLETLVIITKGAVVTVTAAASALVGSLAQWSNEPVGPNDIQWTIIIATAVAAGGTAMGAFLSSAFGKYLQARNGVANKPPTP